MEDNLNHHTVSYGLYFKVLLALLFLTFVTVGVTSIELGIFTVLTALLVASAKAALVLVFFMHLKFDKKIFTVMVVGVLFLFIVVIIITFFDYYFR